MPNSVTSIGDYAFSECSGLTSVAIGNSVTSIGDWAFYGCSGLTSMAIGNSVTSIGEYTFDGCSSLKSIVIPSSVMSIGMNAFSGCYDLERIEAWAKVPPVCEMGALSGVPTYRCELVVSEGCVDAYRNADQWKDFLKISAGIDDVVADKTDKTDKADVKVSVVGGEIAVTGEDAEGAVVKVYGIGGELVYKGKSHSIAVPRRGIYIVSVAGKVQKVAVQ